jgi:hypothetical protein
VKVKKGVVDMVVRSHLELLLECLAEFIFIRPHSLQKVDEKDVLVVTNHLAKVLFKSRRGGLWGSFHLSFGLETCLLPVERDGTTDLDVGEDHVLVDQDLL